MSCRSPSAPRRWRATLRANPAFVPPRGGTVELVASVLSVTGRALSGVPVTFTTTEGTLSATRVISDESGEAHVADH